MVEMGGGSSGWVGGRRRWVGEYMFDLEERGWH